MYLVIGASGYLGHYIIKNIFSDNKNEKIIATYNNNCGDYFSENFNIKWIKLDLLDFNSIDNFFERINNTDEPLNFIYLASYHHPDDIIKNMNYAWNINITSLSYFLSKIKNINSFYYASTEMVYGESIEGKIYEETDELRPVNIYGIQKMLAEKLVLSKGYNVVRFSILMGRSLTKKQHFTDIILESVKNKNFIDMLNDTYRNIIDFEQASQLLLLLIRKYASEQIGVVNISGDDLITKYDFAKELVKSEGLDNNYIKALSMKNNNFFIDKRPNILIISNAKLKKLLNIDKIILKYK